MLTTVEKAVTAGVRTIAGTPGTLETTVAERTSTAEGRRQQQRLQPKRYSWVVNSSKKNSSSRHASNSRDHYKSWDATAVITLATAMSVATAETEGLL